MRSWSRVAIPAALLLVGACSGQPTITPPASQPTSSPATPTAQPTPTSAPTQPPTVSADVAHDGPVLVASDLGSEFSFTMSSAYFVADSVQHLYVIGFGNVPGDQRVFHATSSDGLDWSVDQADPFANLGLDLSNPGPIPASVLPADDGTWQMYLWGVPAPQIQGSQIYRATASDPAGPWVADRDPVVPVGQPGEVDDGGLDFPSVVPDGDGYLMLYSANGGDQPNAARVLLATSDDGLAWEKHGRVIEPNICGDVGEADDFVSMPRAFAEGDGFFALVLIGNDVAAVRSPDGEHWECASDGMAFEATQVPGSDRVHSFSAARVDEHLSLLIEALMTSPEEVVTSELWLAETTDL